MAGPMAGNEVRGLLRHRGIGHAVLALAYALRGRRALHAAGFVRIACEKLWRRPRGAFLRGADEALSLPDGLVDMGGGMDVERLLTAYSQGIFPWRHIGPVKWWAPSRRAVLFLPESRIGKNLRRLVRQGRYRVTFDTDFEGVMRACAAPREGRHALTWISPAFIDAYCALFEAGHAHSVEVRDGEGNLAGGLYGVVRGGVFFTESMFARQRDTSKIAFVTLNRHLAEWGFVLNDGKHLTGHLEMLGMREIPRAEFGALLAHHAAPCGPRGKWAVDPALDVAGWEPSSPAGP